MPDQASEAIAMAHFRYDFRGGQIGLAMPGIVRLERTSGDPGLKATSFTAIARLSRSFREIWERQWVVPPFTGAVVGSMMRLPTDGDAGARTASQDYGENDMVPLAGAVHRLRGGQAVGVIFHADLASQCGPQIALHRTTKQPRGTSPFAKTRFRFQ